MSNIKQIFYSAFDTRRAKAFMQSNHLLRFHRLNKRMLHRMPRGKCFYRLLKLDRETVIFFSKQ